MLRSPVPLAAPCLLLRSDRSAGAIQPERHRHARAGDGAVGSARRCAARRPSRRLALLAVVAFARRLRLASARHSPRRSPQPPPAAVAGLPGRASGRDARRPRRRGSPEGPIFAPDRVAAGAGRQPHRLRALRRGRASSSPGARSRSTSPGRTARRPRARSRALGVAGGQAAVRQPDHRAGPRRRRERLRRRRAAVKRNGKIAVMARRPARRPADATRPRTSMQVGAKGARPPDVGDKATRIDTPTVASVGGDVAKIDTRVPPAPSCTRSTSRRARQEARRPRVRDAAAVPEPRLRPGRRRRRAGQGAPWATGSPSSTRRSTSDNEVAQGFRAAGRRPSTCRPSRGPSSSTGRASSAAVRGRVLGRASSSAPSRRSEQPARPSTLRARAPVAQR